MGVEKLIGNIAVRELHRLRESDGGSLPWVIKVIDALGYRTFPTQVGMIHRYLDDPNSNVFQMLARWGTNIDEDVTDKLVVNFLDNAMLVGWHRQSYLR
ncbi:MAG: hypothetical protein ACOYIK_08300, partial [Coriobacteriales bacterium]